jgi:hypothetical protein
MAMDTYKHLNLFQLDSLQSKDLTSPMQFMGIVLLESIHQLHYFVEGRIMASISMSVIIWIGKITPGHKDPL